MSRHTVWGAGGEAERFYAPVDLDDLKAFLAELPVDESLLWVGLGSNLLVRDGGISGTVVSTSRVLNRLDLKGQSRVRVEAGVACAKVARFCAQHDLSDGEFLAGIPGTMGGALAMNAGAFGAETWELVGAVEIIDRQGQIQARSRADFSIGYRDVSGPAEEWFVAAELALSSGSREASLSKIRTLLRSRAESQPTGQRSCGSVFRNPSGDYAGRLIESCGLKGARIGRPRYRKSMRTSSSIPAALPLVTSKP